MTEAQTRAAAIQYVGGLVIAYRKLLHSPRCYMPAAVERHIRDLGREIGTMQAAGPAGARMARMWVLLHGLGVVAPSA